MAGSRSKKPTQNPELAEREAAYPAATLAFYGPDDQLATKATAVVVLSQESARPAASQEWYSKDTDIRLDAEIRRQIMEFLQSERVKRVVMADRIIGCPHSEGIDYLQGEDCPFCPFWAHRDRWTGELLDE